MSEGLFAFFPGVWNPLLARKTIILVNKWTKQCVLDQTLQGRFPTLLPQIAVRVSSLQHSVMPPPRRKPGPSGQDAAKTKRTPHEGYFNYRPHVLQPQDICWLLVAVICLKQNQGFSSAFYYHVLKILLRESLNACHIGQCLKLPSNDTL